MNRKHEIRRLIKSLKTLTYVKSKKMKNLRYKNEKLKIKQENCRKKKKKYHIM